MRKTILVAVLAVILMGATFGFFVTSCRIGDDNDDDFPGIYFAVVADPHYYDPDLGVDGGAFQAHIAFSRKMLAESEAINEAAIEEIRALPVSFVLVAGDLTKDGELSSHQKMAQLLAKLEEDGKKVYVIPGNHDVENPWAFSYQGNQKTLTQNISAPGFADVYGTFGYNEALDRDGVSLSYLVEPVPGLWLLALDSCVYKAQDTQRNDWGELKAQTLEWVRFKTEQGLEQGKQVMIMMHHNIVAHFSMQDDIFPGFTVNDWKTIVEHFADWGVKMVYTGHFHAQDVVKYRSDKGNFIFDIQTGSLVTAPSPYRCVKMWDDGKVEISSKTISEIDYDIGEKSFADYAENALENSMTVFLIYEMSTTYGMSREDAELLAPYVVNAWKAHLAGDEVMDPAVQGLIDALLEDPDQVRQLAGLLLGSLRNDAEPADNNITINLNDGSVGSVE